MPGLMIDADRCIGCACCERACAFGGMTIERHLAHSTDACTLCGACVEACPVGAISLDRTPVSTEPEEERARRLAGYNGIWVFAQANNAHEIAVVTFELLTKARELARARGCAIAALIGDTLANELAPKLMAYGASTVYACTDARIDAHDASLFALWMSDLIAAYHPEIVLFGATPFGRELAPMVAERVKTGLTADCTVLSVSAKTGLLEQTRPAFGGNLMATITCPVHRPQMATVRPGIFAAVPVTESSVGIDVPCADCPAVHGHIVQTELRASVQSRITLISHEQTIPGVSLASAERLVVVGRGIGSKKNISLMQHLADLLGAQLGCTRPLVEAGWMDYSHQVGQTGVSVAPKLLVSIGVSGAIQHLAGIGGAETIIAINEDSHAPIFDVAHYRVVGDALEMAQQLITCLERAKI